VAARRFDRVSIVATLATGGALQVLMAWLAVKLPPGFAPPVLTPLMIGEGWAFSPVASAGWPLVLGTALWLDHRRRRRETGPPDLAERGSALAGAYVLSAFCGALFGVMMAVLAGQAHVGLGDTWLTPTLAAIVVGGVPFRGGRGTLLGVIGGVLMVQAFDMVLVGQGLDSQERLVALGLIMLAASVYHARGVRLGPRA
jgi:ribose transport system permease protein